LAVVNEDISATVRIPGDEVGGTGRKGYILPISADRRGITITIPLDPFIAHAHSGGLGRLTIVDEDIVHSVRVAGDKV
jgi:hypothetical protein